MLATEARGEGTLLEWIHDGIWRSEELFEDDPHSCTGGNVLSKNAPKVNAGEVEQTSDDFREEEKMNGLVNGTRTTPVWILRV